MAKVTHWLKRLGKPTRRRPVSVIALEDFQGGLELWITDRDNRVLRCALERHEVTALYNSMADYLSQAKYLRGSKET